MFHENSGVRTTAWLVFLLTAVSCAEFARAADEHQTGAALRRTLEQPIANVSWTGKPLRGALERIAESQRVAVMLDRRIDPDQLVDFSARDVPLESMIGRLASDYGARMCLVGPVVYVGPEATASVLPTVVELRREEVRHLPAAAKSRLLRARPWQWERLATPKQLIDELEREYELRIIGKENVPHDLWPAVSLPPLGMAERLSLVLAGFHVTFELAKDGSAVRLVPMPDKPTLQRSYAAGSSARRLAVDLSKRFSDARITANGSQLTIVGRYEVHDAIQRLLRGDKVRRPPDEGGTTNYTLQVENKSVGGTMKALGQKLGKKVTFDDVKVPRRLTKDVSFNVKEVSLDQLLRAVLDPAGLKYEINGDTIRVYD